MHSWRRMAPLSRAMFPRTGESRTVTGLFDCGDRHLTRVHHRRANIFFNFTSPSPGTFIIALHYKGREKAILEMDLKLDDLLEKQKDEVQMLDLEYVKLNVSKILSLLNKTFAKRKA